MELCLCTTRIWFSMPCLGSLILEFCLDSYTVMVILTYIRDLKPVLSHEESGPRYVHKQWHKKLYIDIGI